MKCVVILVFAMALSSPVTAQAPRNNANGKAIEIIESVKEKDLPKPVADALRSHRRAIFVSATKVTRGGSVEYRITARGSRKTSMIVKPDGTVLSWK